MTTTPGPVPRRQTGWVVGTPATSSVCSLRVQPSSASTGGMWQAGDRSGRAEGSEGVAERLEVGRVDLGDLRPGRVGVVVAIAAVRRLVAVRHVDRLAAEPALDVGEVVGERLGPSDEVDLAVGR